MSYSTDGPITVFFTDSDSSDFFSFFFGGKIIVLLSQIFFLRTLTECKDIYILTIKKMINCKN